MKVIHFDCDPIESKYQKKKNHLYFREDIGSFLKRNGTLKADIVTGFVYSDFNIENLSKIKNLRCLITRSIGFDNIDEGYCKKNGIEYSNVQYSHHNVAHHTIALILYHTRNLKSYFSRVQKGNFCDKNITCVDLKDTVIGIIGYGKIGKEVAQLAKNFEMKVLVCEKEGKDLQGTCEFDCCPKEEIFEKSDIISLHCDANSTSIGMINEESIKMMKENAILINTARGSLINEEDLVRNIKKFAFVGLDVLENEGGFTRAHPLLKYPNVFMTPHIAYKSELTSKERWAKTYEIIENAMC